MTKRLEPALIGALAAGSPACHCANEVALDTDATASSSQGSTTSTTGSSEGDLGAPFDASRWIGRYHFELRFLPFGERGDPMGSDMLMNLEIFADSTASLFYDDCSFEQPVIIAYTWEPSEPGWIELFPGEGEPSLRLAAAEDLESLRIHMLEPCRALEFEADGAIVPWLPFRPGASCWVDRCTTGNVLHIDYCEGEEPPPCP